MANENKDVIRVRKTTAAIQAGGIIQKQLGFSSDEFSLQFRDTDDTYYEYQAKGQDIQGGNLLTDQFVSHVGDLDTRLNFTTDKIAFEAGGVNFLEFTETTQDLIEFNSGESDIDFEVNSASGTAIFMQGSDGSTGFNTSTFLTGVFGQGIVQIDKTSNGTMLLHRESADVGATTLEFLKRRSAWTVVNSGDSIAEIAFSAADGSAAAEAARIIVEVDGTPGANDMPGRIRFATSPDGSDTVQEAMRINSSQQVSIGGFDADHLLHIKDTSDNAKFLIESTTSNDRGIIAVKGNPTTGNQFGTYSFENDGNSVVAQMYAERGTATNDGILIWETANAGTLQKRMRLAEAGYLSVSISGDVDTSEDEILTLKDTSGPKIHFVDTSLTAMTIGLSASGFEFDSSDSLSDDVVFKVETGFNITGNNTTGAHATDIRCDFLGGDADTTFNGGDFYLVIEGGSNTGTGDNTTAGAAKLDLKAGASSGDGGNAIFRMGGPAGFFTFQYQDATNSDLTITAPSTSDLIIFVNIPTSDPSATGALWNDSGTLKLSA